MARNKLSIFFGAVLIAIFIPSCGSSKELSALEGESGIEMVHIPRALGFMAKTAGMFSGDNEDGKSLKGFRSMDVITCKKKAKKNKIYDITKKIIENDKSELILEVTENREKTIIYGYPDFKKKKIKDVWIFCDEPSELTVIRAKGSFDIGSIIEDNLKKEQ